MGRRLEREGRARLVAVSLDADWSVLRDYFGGEIPPEVHRGSASGPDDHGISTLPETFLLEPDGRPALRFAGAQDWRAQATRALLRDRIAGRER
jgi:hypothetical protein